MPHTSVVPTDQVCPIRDALLSELSDTTMEHALRTMRLAGIAGTGDDDAFSAAAEDCKETRRRYEDARIAFDAHRLEHGC